MPVYIIDDDIRFPDPAYADVSGIVAIGGDLSVPRLLNAYANGIFPWYNEEDPITWWSPDPRMVLFPDDFKISHSLKQVLNQQIFKVRFDTQFSSVIENCSLVPRNGQMGTWIHPEMKEAYIALHKEGFAHSVETYYNNELVGGLYGLSLGKAFFGESMFYLKKDASKVALFHLVKQLKAWGFDFIDAQTETTHLRSLGAKNISRSDFLIQLKLSIKYPTRRGKW